MKIANLIPIDDCDNIPFPFFDDEEDSEFQSLIPDEAIYKIYHDGGHLVATQCYRSRRLSVEREHMVKDIDILFNSLFLDAQKQGLNNFKKVAQMTDFIKSGIVKLFPDYSDLDSYIERKIKRQYHNIGVRKKRFRRKAYLNRWNYFVTFTYDDRKHNEETFRKKLRKCLSNLHTRRGWRYMGVFEHSPETGRLHFHGLIYIPDGQMISRLTEMKDYSTAQRQMQITYSNDFFAKNFGRNDFKEISEIEMKHGHTNEYLLKYIEKQGERIVYSRGIITEIVKRIKNSVIITAFTDYVSKYVIFDNVINWERDIMRFKPKQMTIIDLLCNPPQRA